MASISVCHRLRVHQYKTATILSAAIASSNFRWPRTRQQRDYSRGTKKPPPEPLSQTEDSPSDSRNQLCTSYLDSPGAPLSMLPLGMVLRSLVTSAVSSTPILLPVALRVLSVLANSKTAFLNPDSNWVLRYALDKTLYKQFCAGENATDIRNTIKEAKKIGFSGAILAYATESPNQPAEETETIRHESIGNTSTGLLQWLESSLKTVRLAEPGDFVAFK